MRTGALLAAAVVLSLHASALVQITNPLPVTTTADLAFAAAMSEVHVASNGANQYALWRDTSLRWFAVELTSDGRPIVATQRLLADRMAFDVTSSGGEFFTVTAPANSLNVSRISADGRVLAEAVILANPIAATITSNATRLFVIYQNNDGSIHSVVLDRSLNFVSNDVAITGSNHGTTVMVSTMIGDRALAIWRNDTQTASGALIDGAGHVTNYFAGVIGSFDQPALASNGTDGQLLWYRGDGTLFSMTLNESAGDPNTRNVVASNAIGPSAIAWDGNAYQIAWLRPGCGATAYDVMSGPLGEDQTPISGDQPAGPGSVELVRSGDDLFVAWLATSCDFGAEVASGRLLSSSTLNAFSLGFAEQITPDVVDANGTTYATWSEGGGIRVSRVNAPALTLAAVGSKPRIAFDGATLLVVWIDSNRRVAGRFLKISPNLAFAGDQFQIGDNADSVALDWNGSTYVATWSMQSTPGAASITTNGIVSPLAGATSAGPSDVSKNLIVWSDNAGVHGRFIGGNAFAIAPAGTSPRAACSVSDCLVTWTQNNDAHGARVSFAATLLDPNTTIASHAIALPMWNGKFYRVVVSDGAAISIAPFGGKLETVIAGNFSDLALASRGDRALIAYTQIRAYVIEAEQTQVKRRATR